MSLFEILIVVLLGLGLIGGIVAAVYFATRNRNNGNNPNANQTNNLCNGGNIPVEANITLTNPQAIPLQLFLSMCNRRRMPVWGWIAIAVLGLSLLLALILFPKSDATQTNPEPTTVVAPVNPHPPSFDPKTVVDPINGKIDASTKIIVDEIKTVDKNLTAHRESSKCGYAIQNKKLDDIKTGVDNNGKKLDGIKQQIFDLDVSLTALRGELNTKVNELKSVLNLPEQTEQIKNLTDQVNNLRSRIESLETKKQQLTSGDPD